MKSLLSAASLAALLSLPAAASAEPQTATAEFGSVRAELRWDNASPSQFAPQLRITRPGAAFDYAPAQCTDNPDQADALYCEQPRIYEGHEYLIVRDVNGDSEPEIVIDLFSGGAHCCSILRLYEWDKERGAYASVKVNFGDPGFNLRDVEGDGKVEFISGDPRFAFAFTSFAETRFPLQIHEYAGGDFTDVTARYPALIRSDARAHWKSYKLLRREGADGRGALGAYLADRYRLGERRQGLRKVRRALAPLNRADRRYLRKVQRLLKRWGYAGKADARTG